MFLLDTNVVSELRKVRAGRADPNVASWAEQVEAETLFLSAITVMELDVGVMRIERREAFCGTGWRTMCSRNFRSGCFPSIWRLPAAALNCTFRIRARSAIPSSPRPAWCMA